MQLERIKLIHRKQGNLSETYQIDKLLEENGKKLIERAENLPNLGSDLLGKSSLRALSTLGTSLNWQPRKVIAKKGRLRNITII